MLHGHKSEESPCLLYVENSGCLISGERYKSALSGFGKKCEILIWNLQKDMVDIFAANPPWNVIPYKRVEAHAGSVLDITYLPKTQAIVTCGSDRMVKVWNVTGTPYNLTNVSDHSLVKRKPGYYKKQNIQTTSSNRILSLIEEISFPDTIPYKLSAPAVGSSESLALLELSETNKINGFVSLWSFSRFNLSIPAKYYDLPIP